MVRKQLIWNWNPSLEATSENSVWGAITSPAYTVGTKNSLTLVSFEEKFSAR